MRPYSGYIRGKLTSNPYRESTSSATASACTDYANCVMGWTLQKFDQDGCLIATTNPPPITMAEGCPYRGDRTRLTGTTTTAYDAETTTVTDPVGKARRFSIDGLGRYRKSWKHRRY